MDREIQSVIHLFTFVIITMFSRYSIIQEQQRSWRCDICNVTFLREGRLRNHEATPRHIAIMQQQASQPYARQNSPDNAFHDAEQNRYHSPDIDMLEHVTDEYVSKWLMLILFKAVIIN